MKQALSSAPNIFVFNEWSIDTLPFYTVAVQAALPLCEFDTRYDFVLAIEPHHRRRYMHQKLELRLVSQFIALPHELIYTSMASFGGGKSFAEAIGLLTQRIGLRPWRFAASCSGVCLIKYLSFELLYK